MFDTYDPTFSDKNKVVRIMDIVNILFILYDNI